jgi:prolipoprotein diacylglyceryl transferase
MTAAAACAGAIGTALLLPARSRGPLLAGLALLAAAEVALAVAFVDELGGLEDASVSLSAGILLGALAGAVVVKRSGGSVLMALDAVAPGLLLAQAIGRIGNWWNQELYGKPTDLPWALEIDDAHNQDYDPGTTFHPTFLYEMIWNLVGVLVLIVVARRWRIKAPALFSLYVAWYTFGRFFEEQLRVDPSTVFWGMRLNAWVSLVLFIASSLFFIYWQLYRGGGGLPLEFPFGRRRAQARKKPPRMAIPRARR